VNETLSLTQRKNIDYWKLFDPRPLDDIFGTKREEEAWDWYKLHSKKLHSV
jgi:hypothetical protein